MTVNHAQEVRRLCGWVIDKARSLQKIKQTPCEEIETALRQMKQVLERARQHRQKFKDELDSCTANDVVTATACYNALAMLFQSSCLGTD